MWESKRDYVTKEEIEFYSVLLAEELKKGEDIKRKIVTIANPYTSSFLTLDFSKILTAMALSFSLSIFVIIITLLK
jgi:hypothetical protein